MDSARQLVGNSPDLGPRVDGLDAACSAAKGRLDDRLVEVSQTIVDRVVSRIKLSSDHTVVALAGATGSGKSSTFNALTGMELSAVGVRRPTTSWATACVWGTDGAGEILDWLGIPSRHQVSRDSTLGLPDVASELEGVVLLDLPDHDSTETSHHLEVDRLIQMADLMVWVLDPQKYADAAIHERYLARLQDYQDVMVVVLNHIDRVAEDRRDAMLADVRRLLDEDGLTDVPILATSALNGDGINALRSEISRRVADKRANKVRMTADIKTTAASLQEVSGAEPAPAFSEARMSALEEALAEAAGVPTVVEAVRESTALRAHRATAWPVTAWFTDAPPDPLRRLAQDSDSADASGAIRTSMPADDAVVKAKVESEVRELADEVTVGLTRPWETTVRRAALAGLPDLNGRLDEALQATDLGADSLPGWAGGVRVAQWALLAAGLAGAVWLVVLAGLGLADSTPKVPYVLNLIPLPLFLVLVGIGGGLLLALASRGLVSSAASARAQATETSLRGAIHGVTHQLIAEPVQAELSAYETVRSGLARALS